MFRNAIFLIASARTFLFFLGGMAAVMFRPSYLQDTYGMAPAFVGLVLLADPIVTIMTGAAAGKAADTRPRSCIAAGGFVLLAVMAALAVVGPPAGGGLFAAIFAVGGLSTALIIPAQIKVALSVVPVAETGVYMGIFQMVQFSTGAFAGALFGGLVERGQPGRVTLDGFQLTMTISVGLCLLALLTLLWDRKILLRRQPATAALPPAGAQPDAPGI
jgi:predicted MFS family arabinose efflux permease